MGAFPSQERASVRGGVGGKVAWGAALAAVLALALWAGARHSRTVAAAPPPAARATPPAPPSEGPGFLGVVVSESVEVRAPFDGRLEHLAVRPGDAVEAGAELGRLDARPLRQEVAMAEARLAGAEGEVARLELEVSEAGERLARYQRSPVETFSDEELASARYQEKSATVRLAGARAVVSERRASLEQARQRLAETTLRAPFAGQVVERFLDAGGNVRAGAPLVRLLRAGPVQVRFAIPEERLGELRAGAPVWLALVGPARPIAGHVERVAPEVDASSRMVFALAVFDVPAEAEGAVVGTVARVSPRREPRASNPGG
ncbi:efflux RND transporter periplasmic adaptor subunit [Myxococcaceae bacterium GXIMD 01537]